MCLNIHQFYSLDCDTDLECYQLEDWVCRLGFNVIHGLLRLAWETNETWVSNTVFKR